MADTRSGVPDVALVPRTSVPAAGYAEHKVLRHTRPTSALGQLDPAIRASTVVTLDGLPLPVKFRNQEALEEWRRLSIVHEGSRRVWDDWASARATCLDCIHGLCGRQTSTTVGPASAPAILPAPGAAGIRAPHWRRGHFRARPCGPARTSRKLIFVAPILIHADQLGGQAPAPKAYELTSGCAWP